ncbi:hypothetical protein HAX54_047482, partial [Datura stramonium]|nr:hypothetical protein [Datura stramonium]
QRKTGMIQLKAATTTIRKGCCKKERPVMPVLTTPADLTSIKRSYGCIERDVVITNGSCYLPVGSSGTMTSPVSNKQQEDAARKEIAKRRQLRDKANSKAQEAAASTTSPPKSDKGSNKAESDGDNPPTDNAGKGNDDDAELGKGDTNAEESSNKDRVLKSLMSREKIPPHTRGKVQEMVSTRIFEGYNMHWMTKTLGKYSMEMVREFHTNYYCTLEKMASSKTAIEKDPVLDSIRVRAIPVDILERTINRVLMGGDFTVPSRTTEYDYRMGAMKGIRKLSTKDKMFHFQWMANIIAEDKERVEWVIGRKLIYKASLNFLAKSWWSIVQHLLPPIVNDNVLSTERVALVACIMSE